MKTQKNFLQISLATLFTLSTANIEAQVVINKFMTSNSTTIADNDGEFSDWIKLHNASDDTVDLNGWYLTDKLLLLSGKNEMAKICLARMP